MNRDYLNPYGGWDAPDEALERLFREHLPAHRLCHVPGDVGLPELFAGNVYQVRPSRESRPARLAVRSGHPVAGAIVLIIEEYLRLGREPPTELAACASMCWLDDLVRAVKGRPLRCRGERA